MQSVASDLIDNSYPNIRLQRAQGINFLFNLDNGLVVALEDDIYDNLSKYFLDDQVSDDTRSYLKELEDFAFFSQAQNKRQAYFHITDRCNLNCEGCYSRIENRNQSVDMSMDDIIGVFDQLASKGVSHIVYSGGEPSLRDDLGLILKIAKKDYNFTNSLITNASLVLDSQILAYLDDLSISIDDYSEGSSVLGRRLDFESIRENITRSKAMGLDVAGIITISEQNIDKLDRYFEIKEELDIPISFSMFYPTSKEDICDNAYILADESLTKMLNETFLKLDGAIDYMLDPENIVCRQNCGSGESIISVDSKGNLSPCHMLVDINLGNLLVNPSSTWDNLNKFNETNEINDPQCLACDYRYLCGSGCRARAYYNQSIGSKDPYCKIYKNYFDVLFDHLG